MVVGADERLLLAVQSELVPASADPELVLAEREPVGPGDRVAIAADLRPGDQPEGTVQLLVYVGRFGGLPPLEIPAATTPFAVRQVLKVLLLLRIDREGIVTFGGRWRSVRSGMTCFRFLSLGGLSLLEEAAEAEARDGGAVLAPLLPVMPFRPRYPRHMLYWDCRLRARPGSRLRTPR